MPEDAEKKEEVGGDGPAAQPLLRRPEAPEAPEEEEEKEEEEEVKNALAAVATAAAAGSDAVVLVMCMGLMIRFKEDNLVWLLRAL
jgi:hypothetical protein